MTITTGDHTDFAHQELHIGDNVIMVSPYHGRFEYGKVVGYTAKSFRIEHQDHNGNPRQTLRAPRSVLKLTEQQVVAYALHKLGYHKEQ